MKPLKIELWPIERVIPYENNAKNHEPTQVAGIAKSIAEFGWDQPIVVDRDGVIIKGHGRRLAALHLKLAEVPVLVRADLTPMQVRAARLADNRVALGGIDTDKMMIELKAIRVSNEVDLEGIYAAKELAFFDADLGATNEDAFVEDLESTAPAEADSKIEETDAREVPVARALGFKSVRIADERTIVAFMAAIEARFGLKGAAAFIAFLKTI